MTTAFVLGGGGLLGAHEVGMLRALSQAGIGPDLVIGTSVGALNGAFIAADPDGAAVRLTELWNGEVMREAFRETLWGRAIRFARSGTHLHAIEPIEQTLVRTLPATDFSGLKLPLHCVAASIERASAVWFSSGPLVPAVLASCAVPGLLPPVEIDGEHYFDGGLVDSIPVGRAVALGATTVYVLQVGRIETPLTPPRRPWEVGLVAFEIARRHRFHEEMSALPDEITVHVLPTGGKRPAASRRLAGKWTSGDRRAPDLSQLRYRDKTMVQESIERAYEASAGYLAAVQNV
jgi:NTE family protein